MTNNQERGGSPPATPPGPPRLRAEPLRPLPPTLRRGRVPAQPGAWSRPGARQAPAPSSHPRTAAIYSRGSTARGAAAHPPAGSPSPVVARAAPGPRRPPRSCWVGELAAFAFAGPAQRTPPRAHLRPRRVGWARPRLAGGLLPRVPPPRSARRPPGAVRGPGQGQGAPRPRRLPTSSAAAPGKPRPAGFLLRRAGRGPGGGRPREPARRTEPKLGRAQSLRAEGRHCRGPAPGPRPGPGQVPTRRLRRGICAGS